MFKLLYIYIYIYIYKLYLLEFVAINFKIYKLQFKLDDVSLSMGYPSSISIRISG